MSFYRMSPVPLVEIGASFLGRFALNLDSPERGPLVPVAGETGMGARPFRADPDGLRAAIEAMVSRYPAQAVTDRREDWDISGIHHHPARAFSSLACTKREGGALRSSIRFNTFQGCDMIDVGRFSRGGEGACQVSYWGRDEGRNADEITLFFLSKKGPPSLSSALAHIFFQASEGEGFQIGASVHRGWEHNALTLADPGHVLHLLKPALEGHEPFSAQTRRKVRFQDECGVHREVPVANLRRYRPWKRAHWCLELKFTRTPQIEPFPRTVLELARQAYREKGLCSLS